MTCATAYGDDLYGLWCEIEVGGVVQRLRWIEPGEFWMGSTEAERKRFGELGDGDWLKWIWNEGPRHRVRLTLGFWLADTACTQALWKAVLGDKSPFEFSGDPELPLVQASWDDVTELFLPRLNGRLDGGEARLPTEAQWEYACRAGSESAFCFGESLDSGLANFNGTHPVPGERECEYRRRTIPVKALPANVWGLYQMHGNVMEWCADARRSYEARFETDPDGGREGADRALRGGSWDDGAGRIRSAYRLGELRGKRFYDFGFRFALRSIEPSAGGGTQAGAEAGGAR